MEFIIKKKLDLLTGENDVEFSFFVTFDEKKLGFKDFDIDDTRIKLDKWLKTITREKLKELDAIYPIEVHPNY